MALEEKADSEPEGESLLNQSVNPEALIQKIEGNWQNPGDPTHRVLVGGPGFALLLPTLTGKNN